jgi:thiol-disulfide isomerase/thioredoxin
LTKEAALKQVSRFLSHCAVAIFSLVVATSCSDPQPVTNPVQTMSLQALEDRIESRDFSGLVTIMASWCPPCRKELPILGKLQDAYKGQHIQIVAVSVDADSPAAVQSLTNELKIAYPVIWVGMEAVRRYKISGVPTLLVIRNGVVEQKIPGSLPRNTLEAIIKNLLKAPSDPNAV